MEQTIKLLNEQRTLLLTLMTNDKDMLQLGLRKALEINQHVILINESSLVVRQNSDNEEESLRIEVETITYSMRATTPTEASSVTNVDVMTNDTLINDSIRAATQSEADSPITNITQIPVDAIPDNTATFLDTMRQKKQKRKRRVSSNNFKCVVAGSSPNRNPFNSMKSNGYRLDPSALEHEFWNNFFTCIRANLNNHIDISLTFNQTLTLTATTDWNNERIITDLVSEEMKSNNLSIIRCYFLYRLVQNQIIVSKRPEQWVLQNVIANISGTCHLRTIQRYVQKGRYLHIFLSALPPPLTPEILLWPNINHFLTQLGVYKNDIDSNVSNRSCAISEYISSNLKWSESIEMGRFMQSICDFRVEDVERSFPVSFNESERTLSQYDCNVWSINISVNHLIEDYIISQVKLVHPQFCIISSKCSLKDLETCLYEMMEKNIKTLYHVMRYNQSSTFLIVLKKEDDTLVDKWICSVACPSNVDIETNVMKSELIGFFQKMKTVQWDEMGIRMKKIQYVSVIKLSSFKVQRGRLDSIPASILLAILWDQGRYCEHHGQNQPLQITQFRKKFRIPANVDCRSECFEHNKKVIIEFINSHSFINTIQMEVPPMEMYTEDLELFSSDDTDVESNKD